MTERHTNLLAELQVTTPIADTHEAAMARYDSAARAFHELCELEAAGAPVDPVEKERLVIEHHKAEIEALRIAMHYQPLEEAA